VSRPTLRDRVESRARRRCEFCHAPQRVSGYRFHVDHVIPTSLGGSDDEGNRALACGPCNLAKSDRLSARDPRTNATVPLFNPRRQRWHVHFRWSGNSWRLIGRTPTGRATVVCLDLNNERLRREARTLWFASGWLP
jgi:hypothetical protein